MYSFGIVGRKDPKLGNEEIKIKEAEKFIARNGKL